MKRILILVMVGLFFAVPSFGFDTEQLKQDSFMIGSFMQSVVSPQSRNIPQSNVLCLEGFGIVLSYTTYFDRNNGQPKVTFDKNNARLVRGLALYLSALSGLKENEKVVVSISDTNNPYTTYTAQVENKYLLAFQNGRLKLEELQKKIKLTDSLLIEK